MSKGESPLIGGHIWLSFTVCFNVPHRAVAAHIRRRDWRGYSSNDYLAALSDCNWLFLNDIRVEPFTVATSFASNITQALDAIAPEYISARMNRRPRPWYSTESDEMDRECSRLYKNLSESIPCFMFFCPDLVLPRTFLLLHPRFFR